MPNNTEHYHLIQPLPTENYDIAIPNENMDIIDKALSDHDISLAGVVDKITTGVMPVINVSGNVDANSLTTTATNLFSGVTVNGFPTEWTGDSGAVIVHNDGKYVQQLLFKHGEINTPSMWIRNTVSLTPSIVWNSWHQILPITDDAIGARAVDDVASDALVTPVAKNLTPWLQGIYGNLKSFWNFKNRTEGFAPTNHASVNTQYGEAAGTGGVYGHVQYASLDTVTSSTAQSVIPYRFINDAGLNLNNYHRTFEFTFVANSTSDIVGLPTDWDASSGIHGSMSVRRGSGPNYSIQTLKQLYNPNTDAVNTWERKSISGTAWGQWIKTSPLTDSLQSKVVECTTATAEGATPKIVTTVSGSAIAKGDILALTFTLGNNASNISLRVNGTAYPVSLGGRSPTGTANTGSINVASNGVVLFYFTGSAFVLFGSTDAVDNDTDTTVAIELIGSAASQFKIHTPTVGQDTAILFPFVGICPDGTIEIVTNTGSFTTGGVREFTSVALSLLENIFWIAVQFTSGMWNAGAVCGTGAVSRRIIGTNGWKYAIGQYYNKSGVLVNNNNTVDLVQTPLYLGGTQTGNYFVPSEYSLTCRDTTKVYKRIGYFTTIANFYLTDYQPVFTYNTKSSSWEPFGVGSSGSDVDLTSYVRYDINPVRIGANTTASVNDSTAVGVFAQSAWANGTAIGANATTLGTSATAIGQASIANGYSVAVGQRANASNTSSVAVGVGTLSNMFSTSIGGYARASSPEAIAIGYVANATANGAIALGRSVIANGPEAIAIGANANAAAFNSLSIGPNSSSIIQSIAIGEQAKTTGIYGLAVGSPANAVGLGSIAIGASTRANSNSSTVVGYGANANANSVAVGSNANSAEYGVAYGYYTNVGYGGVAIGANAIASLKATSIAIGRFANTSGESSVSLGYYANVTSDYATAIGYSAKATGTNSIALGSFASIGREESVAIGKQASSNSPFVVAIGANTAVSSSYGIAIGHGANTTSAGTYSVALGPTASAASSYSVALGYGSTTASGEGSAIRLGSATYPATLACRVPLTTPSDIRDKADIVPVQNSLNFISRIEPVQYVSNPRVRYIPEDLDEQQQELKNRYNMCKYDKESYTKGDKKGSRKRVGVIAQQVQEAIQEVYGTDNYADIINNNLYDVKEKLPDGVETQLTANYAGFVPFLIGAIQELNAKVTTLEAEIKEIKESTSRA